jgi:hypothetical protein
LSFGFGNHGVARVDVVIAFGCKAKIGTPQGGPLAGDEVGLIGVLGFRADVVVLTGENVAAGEPVNGAE